MRKVQENPVVLDLNGTHQILFYDDDDDDILLGDSVNTIKEKTEAHVEVSMNIGLEINAE
jgi:hypothetical protein